MTDLASAVKHEKDVAARIAAHLRRMFPDEPLIMSRAEEVVDALLTTSGVAVADTATLERALLKVVSSAAIVPAPRCPECQHAVTRHDHGSMNGLGECLERTPHGLCWCKHYMTPHGADALAEDYRKELTTHVFDA